MIFGRHAQKEAGIWLRVQSSTPRRTHWKKCAKFRFAKHDIFVLGDTPHDIACARAIGAKAVAIATGDYSYEQLANCHPDVLFHDLADVEKAMAIFGLSENFV